MKQSAADCPTYEKTLDSVASSRRVGERRELGIKSTATIDKDAQCLNCCEQGLHSKPTGGVDSGGFPHRC
ncbi:hypothetical protein AVEN_177208-1 [Araneus ventricosus]|uniref:Uncharacterized protein n=1 Tax=Araneus ventricosus TaxID=182803 RepID=A0A4Y2SXB4_ARAVE|nr:hypothetical protein AVEN_177208-1 [Araneus ventricosus]